MTELFALAPRLGLTANLTRDGRNVLFAYYGRTTETLTLLVASGIDAIEAGHDIDYAVEQHHPRLHHQDRRRAAARAASRSPRTRTAPHADEITAGFRREIFPNTVASLEYTSEVLQHLDRQRDQPDLGSHRLARDRLERPEQDRPGRHPLPHPRRHLPQVPRLPLSSEGQPSRNWVYGASYTLSWTYGTGATILGGNGYNNPRQRRFFVGYHPEDQRHFMRLYGAAYLTRFINLGGSFSYTSGVPRPKPSTTPRTATTATGARRAAPRPPRPTTSSRSASSASPIRSTWTLTLSIDVLPSPRFGSLKLIMDVFNAFNLRTATNFRITDLPTYGQVLARRAPLRVQLALNYAY